MFDPAEIRDRATYVHPSRQAEGMRWVFVNGQAVRDEGKFTKARPGRVLRRPQ